MSILDLNTQRAYKNLHGLFIGVESFPDKSIPALNASDEDARDLAQVFQENENLRNEKCIKDSFYVLTKEEATRENILAKLMNCIYAAQSGDLLIFYLSTHGMIAFNDYYFFPHDCNDQNILATGISATTLTNALYTASNKKVQILVILDTCHSGAIGFDLSMFRSDYACLLSSSPTEPSFELSSLKKSVFTYYLIEALKKFQGKGAKLYDVFDYAYNSVQKETEKKQNPVLIGTMNYNTILLT